MRVPAGLTFTVKPPPGHGSGYVFFCLELLDLAGAGASDAELMARVSRYMGGVDAQPT